MMPALVLDGLGRDGTPAGAKWKEINLLPGAAALHSSSETDPSPEGPQYPPIQRLSIAAYLLTDPSGRSLKGRGAGPGPRLSRHHPSGPPPTSSLAPF